MKTTIRTILATIIIGTGIWYCKNNNNNNDAALAMLALQNQHATIKFVNNETTYCDYGLHIQQNGQTIGNELANGEITAIPAGIYDLEAHCDADTTKNITKSNVEFSAGQSYEVHVEKDTTTNTYILEIH